MKHLAILCLVVCVFGGLTGWAAAGDEILIIVNAEGYVYFPDGTLMFYVDYGIQIESARLTGRAAHYGNLIGSGHIMNDGQGRDKGQQFMLDPFYGVLPDRCRTRGTMNIIQFDSSTGTMEGECAVYHEVFGTAEEVLALYPWAEPRGSEEGKGWWLIGMDKQVWSPVYP